MIDPILSSLVIGMADPRIEKARRLIGLDPKYPIMAVDNMDKIVENYSNRGPLAEKSKSRFHNDTEGLYLKGLSGIYINRNARPYKNNDINWLAGVISHENEHTLGADESKAYRKQREIMDKLNYDKNSSYYKILAKRIK